MLPAPRTRHRRAVRLLSLPATGRRACTITQPDPPIRGRAWIGSSADGWVITSDDRSELHLLNPVTGVQFQLPSVTTFPFVKAAMQDGGVTRSYLLSRHGVPSLTVPACDLRFLLFVKAIAWWSGPSGKTSAAPSSSTPAKTSGRDYTVALIYRPYERLAFVRSGDRAWRTVDLLYAYGFTDLIHRQGWLLTVDAFGQVAAWDLDENPAPVPRMLQARPAAGEAGPGCTSQTNYLVVSAATGTLLQLRREGAPAQGKSAGGHRTAGFRVFRLEAGRVRWVEVEGLGGEAVFLGRGHSVAVMAGGSTGVEGDCIYFTDDYFGCPEVFHGEGGDMGTFCMGDGGVRKLAGVEVPPGAPSPLWITPSLQ
ncbi:hypothetical protein Taro_007054 [Colocasia esculenta]|uniref:KIB1-4 beta-propeller domain-containing protein n=1 Tax=Colocasia esculenta TaxID=4460 RepID=A0A843TT08_COLES|nr:hypothetical protein [Colocasia esculenta]